MQKFGNEEVENKVVELLTKTNIPVSIDYVAHHLHMSWSTARGLLLNMTIKGKIEAEKTTKSLIFRLPNGETIGKPEQLEKEENRSPRRVH